MNKRQRIRLDSLVKKFPEKTWDILQLVWEFDDPVVFDKDYRVVEELEPPTEAEWDIVLDVLEETLNAS